MLLVAVDAIGACGLFPGAPHLKNLASLTGIVRPAEHLQRYRLVVHTKRGRGLGAPSSYVGSVASNSLYVF